MIDQIRIYITLKEYPKNIFAPSNIIIYFKYFLQFLKIFAKKKLIHD